MRFKDKLKTCQMKEIWDEYCGFLDLNINEYMQIQKRLLAEQIELYSRSGLGQKIMHGEKPSSVEEFRRNIPLTTYEDYADVLLMQKKEMLPGDPVVWLETTWESGSRPKKLAPYTREMLDVYTNNILAAMILSTSEEKGKFRVKNGDKSLYGLAPLPYATGLFPLLIAPEMDLKFMPSLEEARNLSFTEQNKKGFAAAMKGGLDQFFGMSSVVYTITKNFENYASSGGLDPKKLMGISPSMLSRLIKAKYVCDRDKRPIKPKDIFDLKGFVCVGTDTALFRDELEEAWGRRPLEIHGGTEPGCMGTETWNRNGLVFFPDNAFYEFIPREEMLKNEADPSYIPRTYTMDEVIANQEYEIVLTTFKGGAFMRYRPGDMYRCLRTVSEKEGVMLPQFEYVDRVPWVIDIAGFTRITEGSIRCVLDRSCLPVGDWFAMKEYNGDKRSFMHFFVELNAETPQAAYLDEQLIKDHFGAYFRHYDHDYKDLKRLLGVEPLVVTILPMGALKRFEERYGYQIRKINPSMRDVIDLSHMLHDADRTGGGR
ncbi:MAG: GH3 auxin-responsive promoter family protein [Firmicutes bacterium]|nr:GH3 auxin-responsive promoter family protein [Bacillota bacterium]